MLKIYITLLFLFLVSFSAKATELSSNISEDDIDEYIYENSDEDLDEEIIENSMNDNDISSNIKPKPPVYHQSPIKRVSKFAWGEPVDNGLLTGMLSYHTDPESRSRYRWNHNLIGLQYKGFIASTFTNSGLSQINTD